MGHADPKGAGTSRAPDAVVVATAPARWLLELAADGGAPLTQTHALARAVVREAAERWPEWWNAELFGPPHREADLPVLEALREGLRRLRLVRRRGRALHATPPGRKLLDDPEALLHTLAHDLGGGDAFTATVADEVIKTLATSSPCTHDALVRPAVQAAALDGWQDPSGQPPDEPHVSWYVSDVLRRGEAYGLIERGPDRDAPKSWRTQISLSPAAALLLTGRDEVSGRVIYLFDAELKTGMATAPQKISARLAVASHESLTTLHNAIQRAFGWDDDHLYSFWLDGRFWGDASTEYVRPGAPDTENASSDVPLDELGLNEGAKIAYVFDYGDGWRVLLTLRKRLNGEQTIPRVSEQRGVARLQYPPLQDD